MDSGFTVFDLCPITTTSSIKGSLPDVDGSSTRSRKDMRKSGTFSLHVSYNTFLLIKRSSIYDVMQFRIIFDSLSSLSLFLVLKRLHKIPNNSYDVIYRQTPNPHGMYHLVQIKDRKKLTLNKTFELF